MVGKDTFEQPNTLNSNLTQDEQIHETAELFMQQFLNRVGSQPNNPIQSLDQVNCSLQQQSLDAQIALDTLEQIENTPYLNQSWQTDMETFTTQLTDTFQQVDQLEKVMDFVELKADSLDLKLKSMLEQHQTWLDKNHLD